MRQRLEQQLSMVTSKTGPVLLQLRYGDQECRVRLTKPAAADLLREAAQHNIPLEVFRDEDDLMTFLEVQDRWRGVS